MIFSDQTIIFSYPGHSYDYSFTSSSMCCQPGGWYENGVGIEPVSAYAIQDRIKFEYTNYFPRDKDRFKSDLKFFLQISYDSVRIPKEVAKKPLLTQKPGNATKTLLQAISDRHILTIAWKALICIAISHYLRFDSSLYDPNLS